MNAKSRGLMELSCRRVQVGTETLADGTEQPIFEIEPCAPSAYRYLIDIVTNQHPNGDLAQAA